MSRALIDIALPWAAPAAAWMLTYLLHSTVLLAAAAALGLLLGERRAAFQEVVWKAALVGGIATATLQAGLGWTPLAGAWELPGAGAQAGQIQSEQIRSEQMQQEGERLAAAGADRSGAAREAGGAAFAPAARPAPAGSTAEAGGEPPAAPPGTPAPTLAASPVAAAWPLLAVAAWLALAALFAGRLGVDYLRLAARLRERWPVADGAVAALFGRLLGKSGRRGPVALTGSERLPVPIAWGLARPEVSLPARVLRDLSPYHQESILAHELAHVLRRDPAWLAAARAIEAALFFQPLNRLARRRLQELAELRSDDRAVELTGRPMELARCLTEVAAWRMADLSALPVPSMASGSSLGRRVRRLVHGESGDRLPGWVRPVAVTAVLAVALAAPAVSGGRPAPQEPEAAPAPAAAAQPDRIDDEHGEDENAGWAIVDGRSWDELSPEERAEARRDLASARRHADAARQAAREALDRAREQMRHHHEHLRETGHHAHLSSRDAARIRAEALRSAAAGLETARRSLHAVDVEEHLRVALSGLDESLPELVAGSVRLGLSAAAGALSSLDMQAVEADVARAMAELEREMPRIEAEIERAMAEVERDPARRAEIERAMAELEAEMPRIEAEIERAMAEAEHELAAELPEIEAELAAAMAELEAEMPRIEAELAHAMAEVEAEWPEIEAEIERAMEEVERELAEIEAEIEAEEAEDEETEEDVEP